MEEGLILLLVLGGVLFLLYYIFVNYWPFLLALAVIAAAGYILKLWIEKVERDEVEAERQAAEQQAEARRLEAERASIAEENRRREQRDTANAHLAKLRNL